MKLTNAIAVLLVWSGLAVAQQSANNGQAQAPPTAPEITKEASAPPASFELDPVPQGAPTAAGAEVWASSEEISVSAAAPSAAEWNSAPTRLMGQ